MPCRVCWFTAIAKPSRRGEPQGWALELSLVPHTPCPRNLILGGCGFKPQPAGVPPTVVPSANPLPLAPSPSYPLTTPLGRPVVPQPLSSLSPCQRAPVRSSRLLRPKTLRSTPQQPTQTLSADPDRPSPSVSLSPLHLRPRTFHSLPLLPSF